MTNQLVAIIGCTGTGKSELAIAIAKRYNGEVINADSMQMYKGLDIATNKVTESEMQNIPHHLLSFLEPTCSNFNVHKYREEALKVIEKLWAAQKLPILVGGTTYYVESVLYKDNLISTGNLQDSKHLENLSNDELYEYLQKIDMASAQQIHKNNRLRVERAIQIFEATGIPKSEHLAKQKRNSSSELGGNLRFPNTLVFFLDSEQQILDDRLDARVVEMDRRGLRKEIVDFYNTYSELLTTRGINQSIALKEFMEYLQSEERIDGYGYDLYMEGCKLLKTHTRQYSRKQRSWIEQRILRRPNCREIPLLIKLDTSKDFSSSVVPHALDLVQKFFEDAENTKQKYQFDLAGYGIDKPILAPGSQAEANQVYHCDLCNIDVHGTVPWESHLKGRKHKYALKTKRRNELKLVQKSKS